HIKPRAPPRACPYPDRGAVSRRAVAAGTPWQRREGTLRRALDQERRVLAGVAEHELRAALVSEIGRAERDQGTSSTRSPRAGISVSIRSVHFQLPFAMSRQRTIPLPAGANGSTKLPSSSGRIGSQYFGVTPSALV